MEQPIDPESTIVVPKEMLSSEALDQLVEEFVLREGTDYGSHEYSLSDKKKHVYKQLEKQMIYIVFDIKEESINLLKKEQIPTVILSEAKNLNIKPAE